MQFILPGAALEVHSEATVGLDYSGTSSYDKPQNSHLMPLLCELLCIIQDPG